MGQGTSPLWGAGQRPAYKPTKKVTITGYGLIKQYISVNQLLEDWELDSLKSWTEENKEILEELGI